MSWMVGYLIGWLDWLVGLILVMGKQLIQAEVNENNNIIIISRLPWGPL